jgi:hypothetical protein
MFPRGVALEFQLAGVFEQYWKHASRALGLKENGLVIAYSDNLINSGLIQGFRARTA